MMDGIAARMAPCGEPRNSIPQTLWKLFWNVNWWNVVNSGINLNLVELIKKICKTLEIEL